MKKLLPTLLMAMALIVSGAWAVINARRAAMAEHTLNETRLAALGETAELMQSLSLSMEKAMLSRDAAQTAALLSGISRDAGDVSRSITFLSTAEKGASAAMALTENLAEDAARWLGDLVDRGSLSASARESLSGYLAECSLLAADIAMLRQEVLAGKRALPQASRADEAPRAVTALPDAKGLPRTEITAGQAMTLAREFVGTERVTGMSQIPDLTGPIAAWGVALETGDVTLNAYVTQIGGKVLLMAPETASFQETLSVGQCRAAAEAFLANRGFASMESSYHQVYDGLCVLTFVYAQNGVLIYPDRVSVQVRMDTGEVVGLEASAYWQHHAPRTIPAPALTKEEARARLADEAEEQSARLCLFPEAARETLCWEFTVRYQGETFLVYIDARDGREVALQKLVMLENGVMAA